MKYEYAFIRGSTVQWLPARSTTLLGAKREAWAELGDMPIDGEIHIRKEPEKNGMYHVVSSRKVIASQWEDTL